MDSGFTIHFFMRRKQKNIYNSIVYRKRKNRCYTENGYIHFGEFNRKERIIKK